VGLRRGARGPLRGETASTVNPLYDGPKAEVRRVRPLTQPALSDEYLSPGAGGHGALLVGGV